ncbi:hypothetical protein [Pseudoalteromonas luteoviolacea]|uniref:Uncharacterized protein n=1 Tax=Pseudoalteromonas luteoviolacea S4060-1 TaxID=1365257 RepID=A0A162B017_9GAMM|nr:hypothetical protein [Pseudoalteromonas luteoviolacea]KZN64388.1 hypothetical protein N478_22090 [Pseudoalteromonas luteoviolacea S4060-1]
MIMQLSKKSLKSLTNDSKALPVNMTPNIAGGKPKDSAYTHFCTALAVCRTH